MTRRRSRRVIIRGGGTLSRTPFEASNHGVGSILRTPSQINGQGAGSHSETPFQVNGQDAGSHSHTPSQVNGQGVGSHSQNPSPDLRASSGGFSPQLPTHSLDTGDGPTSPQHELTLPASGNSSAFEDPIVTPFFSIETSPRIVQRVRVPPREELKYDGKIVIRLADDKQTFLGSPSASRFFTREIKNRGDHFWKKWSAIPNDVKESWWREFKEQFYWGPFTDKHDMNWPGNEDWEVHRAWNAYGSARYSHLLYITQKNWREGKPPQWMSQEALVDAIAWWTSNLCIQRSTTNKANRNSSINTLGQVKHTSGSIPIAEHAERLKDFIPPGVQVHALDVFQYTHKKKLPANAVPTFEDGWVDEVSKATGLQYISDISESQPGSIDIEPSVWEETVAKVRGEQDKKKARKDRTYGFGRTQLCSNNRGGSSLRFDCSHQSNMNILTPELQQLMQAEVAQARAEIRAEVQAEVAQVRVQMEAQFVKLLRSAGIQIPPGIGSPSPTTPDSRTSDRGSSHLPTPPPLE